MNPGIFSTYRVINSMRKVPLKISLFLCYPQQGVAFCNFYCWSLCTTCRSCLFTNKVTIRSRGRIVKIFLIFQFSLDSETKPLFYWNNLIFPFNSRSAVWRTKLYFSFERQLGVYKKKSSCFRGTTAFMRANSI